MREIKFRGKHIHIFPQNEHLDNIWIYGYLCDENYIGDFLINKETVGQYTGLKDKNGKEIYEGDIVSFLDVYSTDNGYAEGYCTGKVVWDEEELCFYVTDRLSVTSREVLDDCCVIGNIFDNPELIEKQED